MALVLERRATKDEILELYLNDIPLGQRGSFAIRGVSEAARLFFGKDISNLSLSEAATIAGVIQSPSALSPFKNTVRCRDRRNVVLQAMAASGYISQEAADQAAREPLTIVPRALEAELVVERAERVRVGSADAECWVVALRAGVMEQRLWVTRDAPRVVRTEQTLANGILSAVLRP